MASPAALLFGYAFLSNVAVAVLPHEPVVIWYGARVGVWPTTLVATAGTVVAAFVDHRLFVPLIQRIAARRGRPRSRLERAFNRFPFAVIALSGLTPLPFLPFKALAFATGYPIGRYTGAVATRSLSRYALLAWLGVSVRLPIGLYAALFALLLLPSLRLVVWPRSTHAAS